MKKAMKQSLLVYLLNGISILALIFMVMSLFSYSKVNSQLDRANEERFLLTYNANRFMNGSAYLTNEVRAFAATGNQEHYDNYWNEINQLKNRELGVAAMQEIGITSEEQAMIDEMSGLSNTLVPLEEEAMNKVQGGNMQEALDYVYGEAYSTSIAQINQLKEKFLESLDVRTLNQVNALTVSAGYIKVAMFFALGLVVVMLILVMLVTRRKILRPVILVRDQMGQIAGGNLSAEFPLKPNTSEIGMLVASIHETKGELKKYISDIDSKLAQMAQGNMDLTIDIDYRGEFLPIKKAMIEILDAFNQALSKINLTADQVAIESNKMAADAQILSSGAVEQAAAVQQLSASVHDISYQVDSTSKDADQARDFSAEATTQLEICNRKMEDLTKAIEDISTASRQIGGIIKTIDDISFQTTILALNASVEAAHAGEAGKGFAVVADEVQNLANKSAAAAKDITELIENSISLVQQGSALSADTTQALSAGVSGAQKATELVERIAESAAQQVVSLKQLTQGMEQIAEVVQTNASTAEKSASSATKLNNQADELKVSVDRFRLRKNG